MSDSDACIFENNLRELAEDEEGLGMEICILRASLASSKTRSNTL